MKTSVILYYIGILIVFASHVYMLFNGLPKDQINIHSWFNLVACCLIAYGWIDNVVNK